MTIILTECFTIVIGHNLFRFYSGTSHRVGALNERLKSCDFWPLNRSIAEMVQNRT